VSNVWYFKLGRVDFYLYWTRCCTSWCHHGKWGHYESICWWSCANSSSNHRSDQKCPKKPEFNADEVDTHILQHLQASIDTIRQRWFTDYKHAKGWRQSTIFKAFQEACGKGAAAAALTHWWYVFDLSPALDANRSVSFQLAQINIGQGKVSVSIVLCIDSAFHKKGIPIRPVFSKYCVQYRKIYRIRYRVRIFIKKRHFIRHCIRYRIWYRIFSASTEPNEDWIRYRYMELYHFSMDHTIADINELCSKEMYLRFADGQVRYSIALYHLLCDCPL
jgi:hypothetical protein